MTEQKPRPIRLRPQVQVDTAIRQLTETNRYVDPVTFAERDPSVLPVVFDPDGDKDSDVGVDENG